MGNFCCPTKKQRKKIILLLLGLDNAGKTAAVKKLAGESSPTVIPTVGFSVITLQYLDFDIKVYDLGGRPDIRDIWEQYYIDAHGIVFVVDSSDYDRLNEAQAALTNILSHDKIQGKPLLLLANKQDNENALDEIDLIEKLQLESLVNNYECPALVETCSATEVTSRSKIDPGIKKGYNWLINYIIREYEHLNERVEMDSAVQIEIDRKEREDKIQRLKYLNEREAIENKRVQEKPSNGFPLSDIFVIKNNKLKHSDSDSSASIDSLPHIYYGTIQQEIIPHERPKSATNIIRQHLELDNLHHKKSYGFSSNKTTPVHIFVKPHSAKERKIVNKSNSRALRSAGDSIFVVNNVPKLSMPSNNGSGDLNLFDVGHSLTRNVLPPINNTNLQNGIHFESHI